MDVLLLQEQRQVQDCEVCYAERADTSAYEYPHPQTKDNAVRSLTYFRCLIVSISIIGASSCFMFPRWRRQTIRKERMQNLLDI